MRSARDRGPVRWCGKYNRGSHRAWSRPPRASAATPPSSCQASLKAGEEKTCKSSRVGPRGIEPRTRGLKDQTLMLWALLSAGPARPSAAVTGHAVPGHGSFAVTVIVTWPSTVERFPSPGSVRVRCCRGRRRRHNARAHAPSSAATIGALIGPDSSTDVDTCASTPRRHLGTRRGHPATSTGSAIRPATVRHSAVRSRWENWATERAVAHLPERR